jgi:hypothetical protein
MTTMQVCFLSVLRPTLAEASMPMSINAMSPHDAGVSKMLSREIAFGL